MSKYTAIEMDNVCSDRVLKGIFGCCGCECAPQCSKEASEIMERRSKS